jgi:hypothetical protein
MGGSRRTFDDVDPAPPKHDDAVSQSEQRVVAATADVPAGKMRRAALTDNNLTDPHFFAAEALDAAVLGAAVTPVP